MNLELGNRGTRLVDPIAGIEDRAFQSRITVGRAKPKARAEGSSARSST